ncbi:MAG: SprB repeat-containing protein [Prevotellaceae bacterium]|jgi:hypothetical protein|nr:SprB repeat-containing protein [Prevotellaceae bacterium]
MKTLVKIVFATMLTGCLALNLYAQEFNQYYVEFSRNSKVLVGTSGGGCGDDYHYLEFTVIDSLGKFCSPVIGKSSYGGYGINSGLFPERVVYGLFSSRPSSFKLLGKAGDEDDDFDEDYKTWQYVKGSDPVNLVVCPAFSDCGWFYCCNRSLDAKYKVIVDDPVFITNISYKNNGKYATETDKLILRVEKFYQNNKTLPILQVSADNKQTWQDLQSVSPNQTISLSYDAIVGKLDIDFESWLGKGLYFRVVKTLLNGTKTKGNDTGPVTFYPDGAKFSITSTKQTCCEDEVKLTVHLENPEDAKYMTLDTNRYLWVMALDSAKLTEAHYCTMTSLGDNKFHIEPDMTPYDPPRQDPFIEETDVFWYLQLQDRTDQSQFFCVRKFTIPAKPKEIKVSQMPPGYTINNVDYDVPHSNSKFAMLNITDPSYDSHRRVPYFVNIGAGHEIPIPELGASSFEDLTPAEQEKWKSNFEEGYAKDRKDITVRQNFANAQQGEILLERVERIAMPKDGSFFLYNQKTGTNVYRLHKATFVSGKNIETTPLVPSENVIDFEVTPDGAYCIYKKYNTAGLFILPLTGAIPSSGTRLSDKSSAATVSGFGQELPNHIYKDTSGSWAVASVYNHNMYAITIPKGNEAIITSLSNPVHVLEQGFGFYEQPLSSSNSTYRIYKVDMGRKNENMGIKVPIDDDIHKDIINPPNLPGGRTTLFYSYNDSRTNCVYKLYKKAGVSYPPYTGCVLASSLPQRVDGTLIAFEDSLDEITVCEKEYCGGGSSIGIDLPTIESPTNCYREKTIYRKECTTYRLNQNKTLLTVAPNSSFVIILDNTTYRKISSSTSSTAIPSGSNFKISPNNTDFVFTNNGHTYKNSTAAGDMLIQNQKSSNICFAGTGRYFLFVDPVTGYVYKQYMSDKDALEDTEPLFKENKWNQFLNKNLGTKVSSHYIQLNAPQTWTLKDADGCVYNEFPVFIKAPVSPSMTYTIKSLPSNVCAQDGTAIITYKGGGLAPFFYNSGALRNIGDKITVNGLKYGDNEIQFTDEYGRESHLLIVKVGSTVGITGVTVTSHQTCDPPNGRIQVTLGGFLPGEKTCSLTHSVYPSQSYTHTSNGNSYEFERLPAGVYNVSVSQDDCHFEKTEGYEVGSQIFNITDIAVTPATTLEGNGSATFTFANLNGTAEWQNGGMLFDSHEVTQTAVTTRNGGISPGTYALTVRSNTGCAISTTMTIDKPAFWGEINLHYTKDSHLILPGSLNGNVLFDPYKFKIIKSTGELITESKKPKAVIRQPGAYALYAHHAQENNSLLLHEFTFPVDAIKASVDISPPVCPQGMGTATINIQGGGFGNISAIKASVDRLNYTKPQKFNLDASRYDAFLRDTMVTRIDNLSIHAVLVQPFPFVVPAMEPVSAQIDYKAPSCVGLANGKIQLSDFTGGSGDYEYKINDNAWKDTTVAIDGLGPGAYNVYLRDKKYQCEPQHLHGVKLRAPDTLKVNIVDVKQPKCELGNGSLAATLRGGDGYYRYDWYHNNNLINSADYDAIYEISLGDTLTSGFYKLQIYDGNQCVASDTATLHTYRNPQVETVQLTDATCAGAKDGTVELLATSGAAPLDSVILKHRYLPYEYRNQGKVFNKLDTGNYTLTLRDALGCYTTTPYPLFLHGPEPLRVVVDTILPVVEKGSRSGKIIFKIYGGNTGHKTVWLKRTDGVAVDSLTYINNVIPLSFTQYAGVYRIEVVDSKGCRDATGELRIEEPENQLKFVIKEVKDARCKSQVGSITVEGAGGWGEYRYKREQETNFTTWNTFDNLYPGHYVITVTDKLGATYSETIMVHEPKDSLRAVVTDRILPTCGNNGAFSIQLSGGTPPYKLYENADTAWYTHPQTVEWTGKGSGNYLLHLVDNNGCRFELEENLPATSLLAIEEVEVKYPLLPAASDGEIKVMLRGGTAPYMYQWTQDVTAELTANSPVLTGIPAGYYGVKVTDAGGCTVHEDVMLTDPSYVSFTLLDLGHETAFQAANGYAVLRADALLSDYTLITPGSTKVSYTSSEVTDAFRVQNDTVSFYGLSAGKWLVSGTNPAGYHIVSEFSINVYNEFTIDNISISQVRKKGLSDGQARISVRGGGGGNRYTWTTAEGIQASSVDDDYSSILRDVPAGSYTVKVEDCYGNILQKEIVIEEPEQALTLNVADYQNQSCKTAQDAYVALSAAGGWGDYQFRHRSEAYFSNNAMYRGLEVAGHYFYVTDRQGVIDSIFIDITEPEYVRTSVATIEPVKCKDAFNGSVLFSLNGGTAPYSLSVLDSGIWREGNISNGLRAGSHTFVFKDQNNCVGQDTLTVYVPEPDSLLFTNIKVTHTTCEKNNGKITVNVRGGTSPYQYQWTDSGNTVIGNNAEISGLSQNRIYRLKVTDSNGCMQQLEQRIYPSTLPVIAGLQTTPVQCYGDTTGTAQVVAVVPAEPYAPYSISWSNGDQGASSSRFYEGTHHVTVTDANGCVATRYFDITQPDSLYLSVTEVREPHCYGYNDGRILTGALGGMQPYTYQWSNGAVTPDVENIAKGNYNVVVTDANGCVYQKSFALEEPGAQTIDLGEDVVICPGNTHLLDGKDYMTYRWYTAAGDVSNERYVHVREAGRYFLEAMDARSCPALGEVNIAIGNNALAADFLLASEAALGDTIMIFELSNMTLDSLRWEYDPAAFERISWNNDYDYSYILSLRSLEPGLHNINLYAYSGGCYSRVTKSVDVGVQRAPAAVPDMEKEEPLIASVKLYPNPNKAIFAVEVKLRETADVRLILFSVVPGARLDDRTGRGSDYYHISYNIPQLSAGMYVMMVMAGNERQLVKLIVAQ